MKPGDARWRQELENPWAAVSADTASDAYTH